MSGDDNRIRAMQAEIASLQATIEQRHALTLQVFSCVIDLYGLAINIYNNMPEGADKEKFREGLSTLSDSVNEAQKISNGIVATFGSGGTV